MNAWEKGLRCVTYVLVLLSSQLLDREIEPLLQCPYLVLLFLDLFSVVLHVVDNLFSLSWEGGGGGE